MADPQDLPDEQAGSAPQAPGVPPAEAPPAKKAAAKKAPAKKAPVKKAPARKAPAKKAPANAAPAQKAPAAQVVPPTPPPLPLAESNGSAPDTDGAKQAAAQAKSAVEQAGDSIRPAPPPEDIDDQSPFPFIVVLTMILLAVLWVRRQRRG
jgi:hypothetical protein